MRIAMMTLGVVLGLTSCERLVVDPLVDGGTTAGGGAAGGSAATGGGSAGGSATGGGAAGGSAAGGGAATGGGGAAGGSATGGGAAGGSAAGGGAAGGSATGGGAAGGSAAGGGAAGGSATGGGSAGGSATGGGAAGGSATGGGAAGGSATGGGAAGGSATGGGSAGGSATGGGAAGGSATGGGVAGGSATGGGAAGVPPSFTLQPASTTVRVGAAATFQVMVAGTQPITLQWRKGAAMITGAMNPSYTQATTVAGDDGAQFTVTATNAFGSVTSNAATLTVISQRLFVTSSVGVLVWNNPQSLSTTRAADVTLPVVGARAVETFGAQLFVLGTAGVAGFSDALSVTSSSAPAFTIPTSALTPAPTMPTTRLVAASIGDGVGLFVWSQEGAWLLPPPLSATTTTRAAFRHPFMQLPSLVYVPAVGALNGNRLFMGQISGAGLLAWNDPGLATGTPTHAFASTPANVWALGSTGSRLVGGGSFGASVPATGVGLWNNVTSFSAARAPDVLLASATSTFSSNDFIPDLSCEQGSSGARLAVGVQNLSNHRILVWTNADTATASTGPAYSGALPASPRRVLSSGGRYYALTQGAVDVFAVPLAGSVLTSLASLGGTGGSATLTDLAIAR
jgi:hypothetical protein